MHVLNLEKDKILLEEKAWFPSNTPCNVKGWYKKTQLKIREGRLTKEEPRTTPTTEIEWDKTKSR